MASQDLNSFLAFDFGSQWIGVATGQKITGTASPLPPLKANDGIPNWDQIQQLIDQWQPDGFIVGIPLNMDGTESEMTLRARKFKNRLHGRYGLPAFEHDERLTSFEAKGHLLKKGKTDFKKQQVD